MKEKIKIIKNTNTELFIKEVEEFIGKTDIVITNHKINYVENVKAMLEEDSVWHIATFYYFDKKEYENIMKKMNEQMMMQNTQQQIQQRVNQPKKVMKLN